MCSAEPARGAESEALVTLRGLNMPPTRPTDTAEPTDKEVTGVEILSKAAAAAFVLEAAGELTAPQLAEQVGEPVSSTYRLLTQLSALGWVEHGSRRGRYRLGLMFMRIGGLVEDRIDARRAAMPALELLLRETGSTSFLCVRRGTRAVCIERLDGGNVRSLAMRLGDSLPLHSGAAPKAMLAFLPRAERDAYLEQLGRDFGEAQAGAVAMETAQIRERGYSVSDGDITPGIGAIGAPVYNHRGELEASVSISGLRQEVLSDIPTHGRLVREAARLTSTALGFEEAK